MKDQIKTKILNNYNNYLELEKILKDKQENLKSKQEDIRKELENSKDENQMQKIIEFHQDKYINFNFLVNDSQITFVRLFNLIDLFKELGYEDLPEEVAHFYESQKSFSPREVFIIKNGELLERETGLLEKARKNFLESDYFKSLMKNSN